MNQRSQAIDNEADAAAPASRAWRLWARATRWMLWGVIGLWALFILSWLALHFLIVPRIGDWRPDLERWATRAVGVPVSIGAIRVVDQATGVLPTLVPSFELMDVRLRNAQGQDALQLPRVMGALSVASLWRGRFEQILIENAELDVRRRADGGMDIAGIPVSAQSQGDPDVADWFFAQTEFVVRGGTVRWIDERRALPPLRLTQLDLVVRNGVRSHELRLDATPEPEWGERFSLRAQWREPLFALPHRQDPRAMPWARWRGELYADLPHVDVTRLRERIDLPTGVDVRGGLGRVRAWARMSDGLVHNLTIDTALTGVDVQLGPDLPTLALDTLAGRLDADWSAQSLSLGTDNLGFRTREGLVWPGGRIRFSHTFAQASQPGTTAVQADLIELTALAALAERLPLPAAARERFARLAPQGRVEKLNLSWQSSAQPTDAPLHLLRAQGRVVGLVLTASPSTPAPSGDEPLAPGRPGIENATLDFDMDHKGGSLRVALRDGAIWLPDVLAQPRVALAELDARARWQIQGERIDVQIDELSLRNDDLEGRVQARWHTHEARPAGASPWPGVLDLDGRLERVRGTAVHRYLPMAVSADARRYVREAVLAGEASAVGVRIQGDLNELPFHDPASNGVFRIAARLDGVDMDFVPSFLQSPGEPAWPGLRGAALDFLFERDRLVLDKIDAAVAGASALRASPGRVAIEGLMGDTRVVVGAQIKGSASEALAYVQTSPLNGLMEGALAQARITGTASTDLRLNLPLADLSASQVSGQVRLAGNEVRVTPDAPVLADARATIDFTERGFAFTAARARVYGGELVFDGGMRPDNQGETRLLFRGQGSASAAALRENAPEPLARLFRQATGAAAYTVQLGFRGGAPELMVSSSLQGMGLSLPDPLSKTAESALPLRLETSVLTLDGGRAQTDRWAFSLGPASAPLIDLLVERNLRGSAALPVRAALRVGSDGDRATLPAEGLAASLRLNELDIDAWERILGEASAGAALAHLPAQVSLQARRVVYGGRAYQGLILGASRSGSLWRANLEADELSGYVEFRPPGEGQDGSVFARLARLKLAPSARSDVEQLLQQPRSVPALDIAVDNLQWADRSLGRVEVDAVNRAGPGRVAEWRLNALRVTVPEARLSASGNWAPLAALAGGGTGPGLRRTALSFQLDVDDSGALLDRLGRPGLVRGGKGRFKGNLGWLGSPLVVDYPSLAGVLQADVERGQFLKVDPGAGRLLGVLSLQALPRRLALDFRDVFSEGFAFDFVRGDARIENGILFTNNLQMKGVNAAVLMEGTADLAREQQNLKVVVVPEINAGTASLIASAINPAVGLGSFLAQFLLRQPLQSAATQEFHITGGWADPQVEKVVRTPPAPAQSPGQTAAPPLQ